MIVQNIKNVNCEEGRRSCFPFFWGRAEELRRHRGTHFFALREILEQQQRMVFNLMIVEYIFCEQILNFSIDRFLFQYHQKDLSNVYRRNLKTSCKMKKFQSPSLNKSIAMCKCFEWIVLKLRLRYWDTSGLKTHSGFLNKFSKFNFVWIWRSPAISSMLS